MDTMSTSFDIITKENIWQYFERWTHLKVKCKFCTPSVYEYLDIANFEMHIETVHEGIKKYEFKYGKTSPNMYFNYINEKSVQCIICNLTIELLVEDSTLQKGSNNLLLRNHIQEHSEIQLIGSYYPMESKYLWKYGTKSGDFEMKCLSCNCNIALSLITEDLNAHIGMEHLDILKNEEKSYWKKSQWSECVLSLESPATPTSFNIVTKENIWQYYIFKNMEAMCKNCGFITPYVQLRPTFTKHIKTVHDNIFKYEERLHEIDQWPWNYFKYLNEETLQCIVCNLIIEPISLLLTNHLHQHTEDQLVAHNSYSCIWELKYCTTSVGFAINCGICEETVDLPVAPYVNQHLIDKYSTCLKFLTTVNMKKISQLSECILPPEFDKVTEENVWQYYERWMDFHVVCRFCTHFIHNFLDITNLEQHFKINHEDIVKYEDEVAKNDWPWQYFKYVDEETLQCIICNLTIYWSMSHCSTTDNDSSILRLHLFEHTAKQWKDRTFCNWIWKYCIQNGNFERKCCSCNSNIILYLTEDLNTHIKVKHVDILESEKKTYEKSQSSECVLSREKRELAILVNTTDNEKLWQHYTKFKNFKAFCRHCSCKFDYAVLAPNFTMHIKTRHNKIFQYEEGLCKWPWRFFKYLNINEGSLQCVICDLTIQPSPLLLTNHLHQHTEAELEEHKFIWEYKYCTESDDFQVECSICKENEIFSISPLLIQHLVENHSYIFETNKQDTSQSSGMTEVTPDICQSFELTMSLGSDTMPTSSNITNTQPLSLKRNFERYCTVLRNFKVQCEICSYDSYVDFSSFEEHIDTRHVDVRNFEENFESSLNKQYFIAYKSMFVQCIICENIINKLDHKEISNHISTHSMWQRQKWDADPWQLKYLTTVNDLRVKCNICSTIVYLSISSAMKDHINEHLEPMKRFQRINTVRLSTDEQSEDQPIQKRALLMNVHEHEDEDLE